MCEVHGRARPIPPLDCKESKLLSLGQRRVFFDLTAVLDASAVRTLHGQIEPLVSEITYLTLKIAAVERLGTQTVQLLVATARALEMNGKPLKVVKYAADVTEQVRSAKAPQAAVRESRITACIRNPATGFGGLNHFMLPESDAGIWNGASAATHPEFVDKEHSFRDRLARTKVEGEVDLF